MAAAVRAGLWHRGVISVTRRGSHSHSNTALKPQYDAIIIGAGRLQTDIQTRPKQTEQNCNMAGRGFSSIMKMLIILRDLLSVYFNFIF